MPRKSKVTAVPIDQPEANQEEGLARSWGGDEVKTDAEHMTEIVNEIRTEPAPEEPKEEQPKPKAKRAPRKRAESVVEPVVEVTATVEETTVEVALPEEKTEAKTEATDKVACPDCGKQMSAKTLKYSHAPNCVVAKKQAKQEEHNDDHRNIPEEIIEQEVKKRMNQTRADRIARKQEAVSKLIANAF
jgi:hypothetical protein